MSAQLEALLAGEDDIEVSAIRAASSGAAADTGALSAVPTDAGVSCIEPYATQLGFIEEGRNELFLDTDRDNWTDGRVGGKPIWMDPTRLPTGKCLQCPSCTDPMAFVLQIYCPLDAPASAYHRCLYVFVCRKRACVANGGFKCIRDQYEKKFEVLESAAPKCDVCGCLGTLVCGKCHSARYCSAVHQRLAWKTSHKDRCGGSSNSNIASSSDSASATTATTAKEEKQEEKDNISNPFLFPEYDLVVETEVLEEDADALDNEVDVDSEEEDEEEAAQQLDTDKHIAERTGDVAYLKFMNRVRKGGASQVLRYVQPGSVTSSSSSGASSSSASADTATTPLSTESVVAIDPKPLCTTTDACAPDTSVPSCQRCGAKRIFEFQIMPQLLYYLNVDKETNVIGAGAGANQVLNNENNEDIEWGSLDVYTCSRSCGISDTTSGTSNSAITSTSTSTSCSTSSITTENPLSASSKCSKAYAEEFVWRQETPEVVAMRAHQMAAAANHSK